MPLATRLTIQLTLAAQTVQGVTYGQMGMLKIEQASYTHEPNLEYGKLSLPKVGETPYTHEQNGQTLTPLGRYLRKNSTNFWRFVANSQIGLRTVLRNTSSWKMWITCFIKLWSRPLADLPPWYSDTTNAIKQHCKGVVKHHPIADRMGRCQEIRVRGKCGLPAPQICGAGP